MPQETRTLDLAWKFAVDESGNFDKDPCVVVCAVGARGGAALTATPRGLLQAELEAAAPWVPWPPHARFVRSAAMHALWMLARPDAAPPQDLRVARELRAQLGEAPQWRELAAACERLATGRTPRHAVASDADRLLTKQAPRHAAHFSRIAHRAFGALRQVVWRFLLAHPLDTAIALASEAPSNLDGPFTWRDRYLDLLHALAERLADAGREEADRTLRDGARHDLLVCDRPAWNALLAQKTTHLAREQLRPLTEAASRLHPEVSAVTVAGVITFDASAPPLAVCADLIANSLFRYRLGRPETTLAELEKRLEDEYGARPVSSGGYPLAVALGEPSTWLDGVRAARRAGAASPSTSVALVSPPLPQWSVTQATLWAEEVR